MKKQFSLEIKNPCNENFNQMASNATGSFCSLCAKNVIDLSQKTNLEVSKFVSENKNENICARLNTSQLKQVFEYNELSKLTNLKYATAIAASVLLTTNVVAQEKEPEKIEINVTKHQPTIMGKVARIETEIKVTTFTIKGKLVDSITKKPLSAKEYPNLKIYVNGAAKQMNIDAKTGKFEIPVTINNNTKQINVVISNHEMRYNNTFEIDIKAIKNNKLKLDISVTPKTDFQSIKIMGGLRIKKIALTNNNS